ncbi:uncharacterized protein LOC143463157 [Clavelina lepadiformis]|uniref:uncharacterized protein LOC143463157 n=1 Tax=Clavelina lepadiformis TaxID=159417 RepID=UPI004042A2DA
MEYLDCSRSARKIDPARTIRYRRADPRSTNIILGYDRDFWETTNHRVQHEVKRGCKHLGKLVKGERRMTSTRKRDMLQSTLSLGNAVNDWKTESNHYQRHDLRSWGPRALVQKDSYAWTDADRRKLAAMRDAKNSQVAPVLSHYVKLPPIYAKTSGAYPNGHVTDYPASVDRDEEELMKQRRGRSRRVKKEDEEDDI